MDGYIDMDCFVHDGHMDEYMRRSNFPQSFNKVSTKYDFKSLKFVKATQP